jgi:hypothetical protein
MPPANDSWLDCSRPRILLSWFLLGAGVLFAVQASVVWQHGGQWTWLLHVGSQKPFRRLIEFELGPVIADSPLGHDGEMFYVIARDPLGRYGTPKLFLQLPDPAPQYRYRRILYPLLAGGGGTFGPRATFFGLIAWQLIGAGMLMAATADLGFLWKAGWWVLPAVLFNLGMWFSGILLTSDNLALGLAVCGVALWERKQTATSLVALALSALARETLILVPLALALATWIDGHRKTAVAIAAAATVPLGLWELWLRTNMVAGISGVHNISVPGRGLYELMQAWATGAEWVSRTDHITGGLGIGLIVSACVLGSVSQRRFLRVANFSWAALGLMLSFAVWAGPTNALRVLAPLWVFSVLTLGELLAARSETSPALTPWPRRC